MSTENTLDATDPLPLNDEWAVELEELAQRRTQASAMGGPEALAKFKARDVEVFRRSFRFGFSFRERSIGRRSSRVCLGGRLTAHKNAIFIGGRHRGRWRHRGHRGNRRARFVKTVAAVVFTNFKPQTFVGCRTDGRHGRHGGFSVDGGRRH